MPSETLVYVKVEKSIYENGKIYSKDEKDVWTKDIAKKWKTTGKNKEITILDSSYIPDEDLRKLAQPKHKNPDAPIIKTVGENVKKKANEDNLNSEGITTKLSELPKDWKEQKSMEIRELAVKLGINDAKDFSKYKNKASVIKAIEERTKN